MDRHTLRYISALDPDATDLIVLLADLTWHNSNGTRCVLKHCLGNTTHQELKQTAVTVRSQDNESSPQMTRLSDDFTRWFASYQHRRRIDALAVEISFDVLKLSVLMAQIRGDRVAESDPFRIVRGYMHEPDAATQRLGEPDRGLHYPIGDRGEIDCRQYIRIHGATSSHRLKVFGIWNLGSNPRANRRSALHVGDRTFREVDNRGGFCRLSLQGGVQRP
jgi:hypothetical protein